MFRKMNWWNVSEQWQASGRSDDTVELKTICCLQGETEPVARYYGEQDKLERIKGRLVDEIFAELSGCIKTEIGNQ